MSPPQAAPLQLLLLRTSMGRQVRGAFSVGAISPGGVSVPDPQRKKPGLRVHPPQASQAGAEGQLAPCGTVAVSLHLAGLSSAA